MALALTKPLAGDQDGDEARAFERIYRSHERRVWGWACRLLGPRDQREAEDVMQDVFVALHQQLAGFRGEAEIGTWLFRTTANIVSQRRRRARVRNWFAWRERQEATQGNLAASDANDAHDTVYRVLDRLDDRSRALIIWFEIEGLSGAEISALLGLKLATVWVRLHRARAAFRAQLLRLEER